MHSNATNLRTHATAGTTNEPPAPATTRGPREWHLGRPSFDRLLDDSPAPPDAFQGSGLLPGDSTGLLHHYGGTVPSHSGGDLLALNDGSDGEDGSDSGHRSANGMSPSGAPLRPTGMAARFGRWLPTSSLAARSSSSLSQIAKTRSGSRATNRPSNVSARLRPSSRQSSANRVNYASDDGHAYRPTYKRSLSAESNSAALRSPPPGPQKSRNGSDESYVYASPTRSAAASRQTTPSVLSPSSPARLPNPWAEPLPPPMLDYKTRRHAHSEGSSARNPRDAKGNNSHQS
ncbi:hypothetical protein GGI13_008504 [Coemansia sp. RSA 455]|nr:hypothetical protein GGI13_008504 [Coemansia sp. RSA 455]